MREEQFSNFFSWFETEKWQGPKSIVLAFIVPKQIARFYGECNQPWKYSL